MHILLVGLWMVVTGIVGSQSAKDLKQERRDHQMVADLREQERELKARK